MNILRDRHACCGRAWVDSQRSYSKIISTEDCPPNLSHKIRSRNISQKDKFNKLWPLRSLLLKSLSCYSFVLSIFSERPRDWEERGSYFCKFYFNWNVNKIPRYTNRPKWHWLRYLRTLAQMITDHFTCASANVICCITCTLCKKLCIGEQGDD